MKFKVYYNRHLKPWVIDIEDETSLIFWIKQRTLMGQTVMVLPGLIWLRR